MTKHKVTCLFSLVLLVLMGACGRTALDELAVAPSGQAGAGGATGGKRGGTGGSAGQTGSGGATGTGGATSTGGVTGTGGGTGTGGNTGTGGGAQRPDADFVVLRPDAGPDLAPDAREEPVRVSCPQAMTARLRQTVRVQGMVHASAAWEASWRVIAEPPNSALDRGPFSGTGFDLVPQVGGIYSLLFEARDARGNRDACMVTIRAQGAPPVVICPMQGRVSVGQDLVLTGVVKHDDLLVNMSWRARPATATVTPAEGSAETRFRAATPGTYLVTFTATVNDGTQASCSTTVLVLPVPMAMCPPSGERFPRVQPAAFKAQIDPVRGATYTWTMLKRPAGSRAEPDPTNGLVTEVRPDLLGDYVLQFVARNPDGVESRCETSFIAVSEPPRLVCTDIDTTPLTDTEVSVLVADNAGIARWQWALASQPPGSAVRPMFPAEGLFIFRPDLAGDYGFTLTVTDDEELSASCKFVVHASAEEGLRVEMFWDVADTDMDLHLLSPNAKRWFDETTHQDCFYSNCTAMPPNWSNPSSELDDPHLDIDDTDGFGPENINVDRPGPGVYRVGAHAFSGLSASKVTVRLYCGGSRLEPRATLGPVALSEEQVWKVADVEIFADGRCEIRKLANPDGSALVVTRANAELAR